MFGGKYLEIACHEAPCDFLEGVVHCILLISKHKASSGMWLKLVLCLLINSIDKSLIKQISMQYPIYDVMIQSISLGEKLPSFPPPPPSFVDKTLTKVRGGQGSKMVLCRNTDI